MKITNRQSFVLHKLCRATKHPWRNLWKIPDVISREFSDVQCHPQNQFAFNFNLHIVKVNFSWVHQSTIRLLHWFIRNYQPRAWRVSRPLSLHWVCHRHALTHPHELECSIFITFYGHKVCNFNVSLITCYHEKLPVASAPNDVVVASIYHLYCIITKLIVGLLIRRRARTLLAKENAGK